MIREIVSGLFVADADGCTAKRPMLNGKVAGRVHACKDPCHKQRCGQPGPSDASYLSFEEPGGADLFLNMIDAPLPLFQRPMFDSFLRYARDRWVEGRPLVIHCNKGESRAPVLAMLFMAKTLKLLPDSFDEAWDEFEKICPLRPGRGIEDWMRGNWGEIRKVALDGGYAAESRMFEEYVPPDLSNATPDELVMLTMGDPLTHFSTHVTIEKKDLTVDHPVPNILQMRMNEAYQLCLQKQIRPMLIILKPRQVGCSTFGIEMAYHHTRRFRTNGMMIGDESSRTVKLWEMMTRYSEVDTFPWDSSVSYNSERCKFSYHDGAEASWFSDTASDPKAGISGTRQFMYYTEAARYAKAGVRMDTKVITASLASLSKHAEAMAIMESTAEGANGFFYRNWQGAVSLSDFRSGKYGNGWVKVFAAWFEFREHCLKREPQYDEHFTRELDDDEKRGIALYGWTTGQIAWRRMMIATECDDDVSIFNQDYPSDDVSAFLTSGRPRFNQEGMTRLQVMAQNEHDLAERGVLSGARLNVMFTLQKEDAWIWMRERPKAGSRYLAFVDPCQGSQGAGSRHPDAHAAGILRAAEVDAAGNFRPAELVAAIDVPNGCQWEAGMLAERMVLLANYFGGCMIIPDVRNGLDVLVKLREHGAVIFQREKPDDLIPNKKQKVFGWDTNGQTREIVVCAIAEAIRDQGKAFNCCYAPAVAEFQTFVIDSKGKAAASIGKHDDWTMGIGMGLACIRMASVYQPVSEFPVRLFGSGQPTASGLS